MECRKCKSRNLKFAKLVHEGPKQGKSYHYRAWCQDCGFGYHVERCKEVFDKVRDIPWSYKKQKATYSV